ncbi:hypothetical protein GCM10011608_36320 [Micromonospora sonchi]|uniref:Uncharacterized protein n=1 Tax=Micromonospora sonchi TaxID=1763543 RepID=A0A917U0H1_9ACTN|nr:hypothetical protein [Micromonospora sonchi]GGM48231.1 hypothetical protein GCM10011608_36320 [Micromonospora sonchi]
MPVQRPTNAAPDARWVPRTPGRAYGPREDGTPRIAPGVYLLTRAASVQFRQPILVRVIRELTARRTYHGWAWVDCYVLDRYGDAVDKRQLFVMPAGLRPVQVPPVPYAERRRGRANASRADR